MVFGLNSIEVIAVLFALFVLIKMIFLVVKKKAWFNAMVKPSIKNSKGIGLVFLVLVAVLFYYLIQSLSIVEIFAVLAFSCFLIFLSLFSYSEDLFKFADKIYSKKFNGWMWLQILIWFVLSVWVLWVVFS